MAIQLTANGMMKLMYPNQGPNAGLPNVAPHRIASAAEYEVVLEVTIVGQAYSVNTSAISTERPIATIKSSTRVMMVAAG